MTAHDAVIVGGGPAGLSAARRLLGTGVRDVVVLERESEAGGIPRHCGHGGFGIGQYLSLPMSGPDYARRLAESAVGADIRVNTTVTAIEPGGRVHTVHPADGARVIEGRCVLLATGIRETPRSARLVTGARPLGVTTTGALQQMVYLKDIRPFSRAVIVGTELVSFSALLTARHGGIKTAAMIEEGERITARKPGDWIARTLFGVPVLTGTKLVAIRGSAKVEAVEIERNGKRETIACDGVIFTGRFTPETALLKTGHIALDPGSGGPVIDQFFRTSDSQVFAAGNLLRPVETAGMCWAEGRIAAANIAAALAGGLPPALPGVAVRIADPIKYIYPQIIVPRDDSPTPMPLMRARVTHAARGKLRLSVDGREVWSRSGKFLPERRLTIPTARIPRSGAAEIAVELIED
jgi:NADPH-dependent 2,4-dienoyl-CoA reductase/sulfur reductase-like enzyme